MGLQLPTADQLLAAAREKRTVFGAERRDRIVTLWGEGRSVIDIARSLKVSQALVTDHLVEAGFTPVQNKPKPKPGYKHRISLRLQPELLHKLRNEAGRRDKRPEDLASELLTLILRDDMIAAVLDNGG